jgi:IclR family pca regulon transcriptional regulator
MTPAPRSRDPKSTEPDRKAGYRVEALARGLRILRLFSRARPALRLNDIAELAGLPLPTAFRLVSTLEGDGFLERSADGSYRPGLAVLGLGFAALQSDDMVQVAEPSLRRLSDDVRENVNIGVLRGSDVLFIARIRNEAVRVTANIHVGSTRPAVVSSIGKLLLAHLPKDEVDALVSREALAAAPTPKAIRSRKALHAALREIRERGWSMQDEEDVLGLRSIAGPLRDHTDTVVAGVSVAVPSSAFTASALVDELLPPLLQTCTEISHRLGAPERA